MPVNEQWIRDNAAQRERLKKLMGRLTERDLSESLGNGWTAAAALVHLAFWDQRALTGLTKWEQEGVELARINDDAVHAVNEAVRAISAAIPSTEAAKLALTSAEAIDYKVSQLSDEMVRKVHRAGFEGVLQRAAHRRHHLDLIEQAIG